MQIYIAKKIDEMTADLIETENLIKTTNDGNLVARRCGLKYAKNQFKILLNLSKEERK